MFYVSRGNVPHKRHTQHRAPDGSLYAEELFGMEGFTGRSSLLYHLVPPTQTHQIERVRDVRVEAVDDGLHRHRLVKTAAVPATGNVLDGRVPLFFNSDVLMGVVRPTEALPENVFYRNGEADEMLFVHEGQGVIETNFGPLRYGPGDYIVIPIGTTWRATQDCRTRSSACSTSSRRPRSCRRKRYRNDWGQLLEHAPFSQRDIRVPDEVGVRDETGDFVIWVRLRGRITAYHYHHHPFDVVGWDGYLFPYIFNIGDFEPITGRVHQPPPVHQTFAGRNYVVCSFVPRKFDYHPLAIPAPYNHSNINSRRGHLLRRRQLHEPPRRGDLSRSHCTRRASRTARIRARSRPRSARRRPRSWRSWSTRSIRST